MRRTGLLKVLAIGGTVTLEWPDAHPTVFSGCSDDKALCCWRKVHVVALRTRTLTMTRSPDAGSGTPCGVATDTERITGRGAPAEAALPAPPALARTSDTTPRSVNATMARRRLAGPAGMVVWDVQTVGPSTFVAILVPASAAQDGGGPTPDSPGTSRATAVPAC